MKTVKEGFMPSFISNRGKWYPAKERVALKNKSDVVIEYKGQEIQPGEDFIYEGPDRPALQEIHNAGEGSEHLGRDFKHDPDFLKAVRDMSYQSVEEYLEAIGYDEEKAEKEFEEKAVKVSAHEIPNKVKMIKTMGGGKDFAGGTNTKYGEFGDIPEII